jgi:D-xylose 1-dehydrogenase (NADP+, D-xylono-1,5-lactone-forming)
VRTLVAEGAIGRPRIIHAGLSFSIDLPRPNIRLDPAMGGVIGAVGRHAISTARFLFEGEPEAIAATAKVDARIGVDLTLAAVARLAGGRMALPDASMEAPRRGGHAVIGDRGSPRVDRSWFEADTPAPIVVRDPDGRETSETLPPAIHFIGEIEHFSAVVRGEGASRHGPGDAWARIRALAAMQRPCAAGRSQPVWYHLVAGWTATSGRGWSGPAPRLAGHPPDRVVQPTTARCRDHPGGLHR